MSHTHCGEEEKDKIEVTITFISLFSDYIIHNYTAASWKWKWSCFAKREWIWTNSTSFRLAKKKCWLVSLYTTHTHTRTHKCIHSHNQVSVFGYSLINGIYIRNAMRVEHIPQCNACKWIPMRTVSLLLEPRMNRNKINVLRTLCQRKFLVFFCTFLNHIFLIRWNKFQSNFIYFH